MTLSRLPGSALAAVDPAGGASGRLNPPIDALATPTALAAFELPWDGTGAGDRPALFAAGSSSGPGWKGAALYAERGDGQLTPLGATGRARAIMGTVPGALPPASPLLLDRASSVTVHLVGADMILTDATPASLALGGNLTLIGNELIQFGKAIPLGDGVWRLERLLRGRGGTEGAIAGHGPGEVFVLLAGPSVTLDPVTVGTAPDTLIAALGLADAAPVTSAIVNRGLTLRPLCPVHPRSTADGEDLSLAWTRRARGAWLWRDEVDAPLHEEAEAYEVSYGPVEAPVARWETTSPELTIGAAALAELAAALPGGTFQVRQIGSYALSDPLLLAALS